MTMSTVFEPRVPSRSNRIPVRGVGYQVIEWGKPENPALVLLHGWGDCAASFQFLVDELGNDWFLIAPDWRGFGQSFLRCASYWFPDYLADLNIILDHYRQRDCVPDTVIGHSMGANIGGMYAGIFPGEVRSFVNVEGFGLRDSSAADAPQHYRRWIQQSREMPAYSTYATYEDLAKKIRKRAPELSHERALYVAQHWAAVSDDGRVVLHADPAHKLPNAIQYRRAEAAACWSAVTADVLMVSGENSEFGEQMLEFVDPGAAARMFNNQQSTVIANCGHMIHLEQPAALASEIERFLARE